MKFLCKNTNYEIEITEGLDVSSIIGCVHYEPPIPQDLNAKGFLPHGLNKTDEENYQRLLEIPYGEIVDVTLKIDGQSMTVYCKEIPMPLETSDWKRHFDVGVTSRSMDFEIGFRK